MHLQKCNLQITDSKIGFFDLQFFLVIHCDVFFTKLFSVHVLSSFKLDIKIKNSGINHFTRYWMEINYILY